MPSTKVETPTNIEKIFSLDCFKFNEMKGIFYNIYEYLTIFGDKLEAHDARFNSIPDFSKIERNIRELEKQLVINTKNINGINNDLTDFKTDTNNRFDELKKYVDDMDLGLDERIKICEKDIEDLKRRPIGEGKIDFDFSSLVPMDEFNDLTNRVAAVEKRNLEQDERLTNNELRISKLE